MFKRWFGVFAVCLMLVACSEGEVSSPKDDSNSESTANGRVEPKLNTEVDFDREAGKKEALQRHKEQQLLNDFRVSLNQVDTQFDVINKTYSMIPTSEGFINEIFATIDGSIDRATWDEMVNTFAMVSLTVQQELGDGYSIVMLNPYNKENMLIAVIDGVVVYNIMNE